MLILHLFNVLVCCLPMLRPTRRILRRLLLLYRGIISKSSWTLSMNCRLHPSPNPHPNPGPTSLIINKRLHWFVGSWTWTSLYLIAAETIQWFQHPGLFWANGRHIQGAVSQVSQGVEGSGFNGGFYIILPRPFYGKQQDTAQGVKHKSCWQILGKS